MSMVPLSAVRLAVLSVLILSGTSVAADSGNEKNAAAPAVATNPQHSVSFRLRLKPSVDATTGEQRAPDAAALAKAEEVLTKRASSLGLKSVVFTKRPPDQLTLNTDGLALEQVETIRKRLVATAVLDFRIVHPHNDDQLPMIEAKRAILDPAWSILPMKTTKEGGEKSRTLMVHRIPDITGDHIKSASAGSDQWGWLIDIQFDKNAGDKFFELTKAMRVGIDRFAIVVDGEIVSAPTIQIQGGIAGGGCRITGKFTEAEARGLAEALMNPLQNPLVIEGESVK